MRVGAAPVLSANSLVVMVSEVDASAVKILRSMPICTRDQRSGWIMSICCWEILHQWLDRRGLPSRCTAHLEGCGFGLGSYGVLRRWLSCRFHEFGSVGIPLLIQRKLIIEYRAKIRNCRKPDGVNCLMHSGYQIFLPLYILLLIQFLLPSRIIRAPDCTIAGISNRIEEVGSRRERPPWEA
jgi:hypothetical protein